jgi:hypothetical protein
MNLTLLQYIILVYLEKKTFSNDNTVTPIKIVDLAQILDVNVHIVLSDVSGMILNTFNKAQSITDGLLTVDSQDKKITENNLISLNPNFTHVNSKLNFIPPLGKKKQVNQDSEKVKENNDVMAMQHIIIDSTITRIMKGRIGKLTSHSELITETVRQIELFTPKVDMVKFRIESLIEKKIIKRKDDNYDQYEYIS